MAAAAFDYSDSTADLTTLLYPFLIHLCDVHAFTLPVRDGPNCDGVNNNYLFAYNHKSAEV
jgi:hypothetical protein